MQTEEGLRSVKKSATRQSLVAAAQTMVLERGLDEVTVDEIAAAAGVSPRTFFNYFCSKDEALVGADPHALSALAERLRGRPAAETPAEALRTILLADDVDGMLARWERRHALVRAYPALLPRHLASMVELEETLAGALADRLGVDPRRDPGPRVLVAAALAVTRSTVAWWWEHSDRSSPLGELMDDMYTRLIRDRPERR